MSRNLKRTLLYLTIPILLLGITACSGLMIDHIQVTLGSNGAIAGASITFNCYSATADDIITYKWTFGDGDSTEGQTVSHSYASTGDFTVECHVVTLSAVLIFTKSITIDPAPTPDIDVQRTDSITTVTAGSSGNMFTFTIENTGTADLTASASAIITAGAIITGPSSDAYPTIAPGDSETFSITFDVTGPAGTDVDFELDVTSNDPDENPVVINLTIPITP